MIKKAPDKYDELADSYMVCKKDTLRNIINYSKIDFDENFHGVLFDTIDRTNKIVFHTYLFIKLYLIFLLRNDKDFFKKNNKLPKFNTQFVRDVMNTITYKNQKSGSKKSNNNSTRSMIKFYEEHYKPMIKDEDIICRDHLKAVLNYEEKDIIKNISTNIKEHFMSHLRFFIKVRYGFDKEFEKINNSKLTYEEKKEEKSKIYQEWNSIVSDIINVSDEKLLSKEKYHMSIFYYRGVFIPFKCFYQKDSVPYDVKANPFDYIYQMININKELNSLNKEIIANHKDNTTKPPIYKLFNSLPLRRDIVPKYITLDTVALIDLFVQNNVLKYRNNPSKFKEEIWNKFFRINTRKFRMKKPYQFSYMIKTDGIACSICFVKTDHQGNPVKAPLKSEEESKQRKENKIKYIEEVPITKSIREKEFVYFDPGKNDLFNAMKVTAEGKTIYFKYTQRQRNHHIKKNKYDRIRNETKQEEIDNKTIAQIESELSDCNSKSCNFMEFKQYASKKIEINRILYDHYKQMIYRKLNWNTYMNTNRNEAYMLNDFEGIMGSPRDIVIIIGDWSDTRLKGKESTISKKLRRLFLNRGYQVYLINEYNTSRLCSHCHKPMENLKVNKKPIWKLMRCKTCGSIHNRDHNSPKNMRLITKNILMGKGRPAEYIRKEKTNDPKEETKIKPSKYTKEKRINIKRVIEI